MSPGWRPDRPRIKCAKCGDITNRPTVLQGREVEILPRGVAGLCSPCWIELHPEDHQERVKKARAVDGHARAREVAHDSLPDPRERRGEDLCGRLADGFAALHADTLDDDGDDE